MNRSAGWTPLSNQERERRGASFDGIAENYDVARPNYPEALFDQLLRGMDRSASILEIGSGTGIATEPVAARGFSVKCVEPGAKLRERARDRLARFGSVTFVESAFEDALLPDAAFDLVFAAQSFHWLDPRSRLAKVATVLRPGGTLALIGNARVSADARFDSLLRAVWDTHAPHLTDFNPAFDTYVAANSPFLEEIANDEHFTGTSHHVFAWQTTLSSDGFVRLLQSYSHVQHLEAGKRAGLLQACERLVRDHGGEILVGYRSGLIVTKRRPTSTCT